jgi:hypothetical protein
MDEALQNPYLNDDLTLAPFAGRQAAFALLPTPDRTLETRVAMLFVGRRHMAKPLSYAAESCWTKVSSACIFRLDTPLTTIRLVDTRTRQRRSVGSARFTLSRKRTPIAEDLLMAGGDAPQ